MSYGITLHHGPTNVFWCTEATLLADAQLGGEKQSRSDAAPSNKDRGFAQALSVSSPIVSEARTAMTSYFETDDTVSSAIAPAEPSDKSRRSTTSTETISAIATAT